MLCSQVSTYKTWLLSSLQVPPKEEKYCLVSSKEEEVVKDAFMESLFLNICPQEAKKDDAPVLILCGAD